MAKARIIIAAIIVSMTSTPLHSQKGAPIFEGIGAAVDGTTAVIGMTKYGYKVREANPLMPTPARLVVVKTLFTTVIMLATRKVERSGHPKAAWVLGYVAGSVPLCLGINNIRQMRR